MSQALPQTAARVRPQTGSSRVPVAARSPRSRRDVAARVLQERPGRSASNSSGNSSSASGDTSAALSSALSSGLTQQLEALLPPSLSGSWLASIAGADQPALDSGKQQQHAEAAAASEDGGALLHQQQQQQYAQLPPRVLAPSEGCCLLFSYGANMSNATLRRRSVTPLSRWPAFVVDPAVQLRFQHRGGYATLLRPPPGAPGPKHRPYLQHVHGVVLEISNADLKGLAKREGGYTLQDVEVETYDGCSVRAKVFVSHPFAQLAAEVSPTEKYMKQLRDGAADQFLDPLFQAWLSSIASVPSVGLPPEYFDTPSKLIALGFLSIVALVVVGFLAP